ncbi:hypothetical protein Vadar_013542 [Vaccinium darrowii]|uniref:Uncharacterized protein n=1 Tax=Vaccinium darrowii TaxID=229202 RepID=A0ACB7Z408_9ERIC|nr:hypothetical protein Vadar_013542 [Vaccinium darrowii]
MLRVAGRRISSSFLCRSAHSSSSAFFSRNPVNASDSPSDGSTRSVYSPHPYLLEQIKGFASDSLATARDMGKIPDIPAAVAAVKNPASKIVYDDHHHELYPPGNPSKRAFSSLRDPQDDSARVNTMNILRPLSSHLPIYKRAFSSLPQDDSASVNIMNILRPLSPHLPIYKPQLTSTFSIFHRITGAFLSTMVLGFYLVCLKAEVGIRLLVFISIWGVSHCQMPVTLEKATAARPFPTMERDVTIFLKKKTTAANPSKQNSPLSYPPLQTNTSNLNFATPTLMAPLTLAADSKSSSMVLSDASHGKVRNLQFKTNRFFASVSTGEDMPFDFLRTVLEGVIAGGLAGVVVETALYPIDTIKTRIQAAHGGGKIIWKGLYSGLAGNIAGVLPASALFVGVYEPAKQTLLKIFPENLSAVAHLTAGAIGGVAASLIRVPTEVVKQRMQTRQFASAPDAVRLIVSREGFKGLYAGYGSFLLRDLPFDALQFCLYEQLRIGYKLAAKRDLSDPENAIIGAFAGALTGAITTPLDVIKTRLMIQGSANQYKGIFDCVQTIVKEEGPPALLKGIGPRVLWIGIGGSIFFGVLESTKRFLAQRRPDHRQQEDPPKQD